MKNPLHNITDRKKYMLSHFITDGNPRDINKSIVIAFGISRILADSIAKKERRRGRIILVSPMPSEFVLARYEFRHDCICGLSDFQFEQYKIFRPESFKRLERRAKAAKKQKNKKESPPRTKAPAPREIEVNKWLNILNAGMRADKKQKNE